MDTALLVKEAGQGSISAQKCLFDLIGETAPGFIIPHNAARSHQMVNCLLWIIRLPEQWVKPIEEIKPIYPMPVIIL
ncbi:MAG: hypothetical protein ABI707_06680 [Ferruginibacter sp.]